MRLILLLAVVVLCLMNLFPSAAFAQAVSTVQACDPTSTTCSVGTVANTILQAVLAAFAAVITPLIILLVSRLATGVGVSVNDAQRQMLDKAVTNGLNVLAPKIGPLLNGKFQVEVGSEAARMLVNYVNEHATAAVAYLAKDKTSASFEEAIVARANKSLNDPGTPTPAEITPPATQAIASVVASTS
ncbi:MAG: hypothetical protein JWN75_1253 [Candidatus Saccharibacteria bacterium]|nr:hypothetical protein [Candidatus Saccharibacteria bacterium]